jgi:hypothetical protein
MKNRFVFLALAFLRSSFVGLCSFSLLLTFRSENKASRTKKKGFVSSSSFLSLRLEQTKRERQSRGFSSFRVRQQSPLVEVKVSLFLYQTLVPSVAIK